MQQLKLRLKTLLDKKRMMQTRNAVAPKISASFITLEEGFQQFGTDLSKLQVCNDGHHLIKHGLNERVAIRRNQRYCILQDPEEGKECRTTHAI